MKQILCFGDSNTYGLIPGTTNQRYGWGTRWTSILDDKVRTKGYKKMPILHERNRHQSNTLSTLYF